MLVSSYLGRHRHRYPLNQPFNLHPLISSIASLRQILATIPHLPYLCLVNRRPHTARDDR